MSELRAWHGDAAVKQKYVARFAAHRAADQVVQGRGVSPYLFLSPCWKQKFDAMQLGMQAIQTMLAADYLSADPLTGFVYCRGVKIGGLNTMGYVVCSIRGPQGKRQYRAHHIVWVATHGIAKYGLVVDHINGSKSDNRIANLQLLGSIENSVKRRTYAGSGNPAAKLNEGEVAAIRAQRAEGDTYAQLATRHGVSKSLIAAICRGEVWKNDSLLRLMREAT